MQSAVCLIVKNEAENIAEWVAHYSMIGFDQIIAYDNMSDDGTTEILDRLKDHYNLTVRPWSDAEAARSSCKQMAAYEHCLASDGARFDWLAYLDADEFLIPPPGETIGTLLHRHRDADGIAVNWRIFGSSALESSTGRLVMEAFNRRAGVSDNTNRHVKMLFRPRAALRLVNPHFVETERPAISVDGSRTAWSEPGITDPDGIVSGTWKLHHYIIRSRRHWERRMQRRQTDGMMRDWSEFDLYDRNEVLDVSALDHAERVAGGLARIGFSYAPVPVVDSETALAPRRPNFAGAARRPAAAAAAPSDYVCFLDGITGGHAHGWAHDPASAPPPAAGDPSGAVTLLETIAVIVPVIDGTEGPPVPCDMIRRDVKDSGIGSERVGFAFDVDPVFLDGKPHSIALLDARRRPVMMNVAGRRVSSHVFSDRFKPTVYSAIDTMQNSVLRGWVACRRTPTGAIETGCDVLVTVDGTEIGRFVADRPRPDVGAALGCDNRCGLSVMLPDGYRRSKVQEIRFFLQPEGIELAGSPLVTSFAQHDHAMKLLSLIDDMEDIAGRLDTLRSLARSIVPSTGFTLDTYDPWFRQWVKALRDRNEIERAATAQHETPLVSIVCPVYKPDLRDFTAAIQSVIDQSYANWELILVDDGSKREALSQTIQRLMEGEPRIRLVGDGENRGISGATNLALQVANGDWVLFFDHDDLLVDIAIERMVRHAHRSGARLIYSDEDKIDEFGFFSEPAFKPDWNYRYLLGVNYVNHITMVSMALLRQVGLLDPSLDGAQDHDFLLRCAERLDATEVAHLPEVLYHWRKAAQSTALLGSTKSYAAEAGVRAIAAHLGRCGKAGAVSSINGTTHYAIDWSCPDQPRITVVIPFKDKLSMTRRCVAHIARFTDYPNLDIVLVDNGSVEEETLTGLAEMSRDPRVSVLRIDEEFNYSRLNNLAAARSDAAFFVFMNNDLFVQDAGWLRALLDEALIDERVGAVGGKFLFEDRTIQHNGVVLGIGGVAGHVFVGEAEMHPGYGSRAVLAHEVSAVTAACVLVRASAFREIGGFDEINLKVAFNDIDLCLRLRQAGFRTILNPRFVAEHHESISRGSDDKPEKVARFNRESDYMKSTWGDALTQDPFYNRNFSLSLKPFHDLSGGG